MRPSILLLAAPALLLAAPAAASDGVLNINQACAVQTGCFTGDTAGYPVTIATSGSYVLTGNLVVPDENTTAILVSAPSVHIDLNGFEIVRAACQGATSDCTPGSGSGRGVDVSTSSLPGVSLENGSITGMGNYGAFLGEQANATNLRVRWNRGPGISVADGSVVSGNSVLENGGDGIVALLSAVSGNAASRNGGRGISANLGSTVSGNTADANEDDGIAAFLGSVVSGNAAYGNGGDGIQATVGVPVSGNSVRSNAGYGLALGTDTTYRENTVTGNFTGAVSGGVNRGDNYCDGTGVVSAFCP